MPQQYEPVPFEQRRFAVHAILSGEQLAQIDPRLAAHAAELGFASSETVELDCPTCSTNAQFQVTRSE